MTWNVCIYLVKVRIYLVKVLQYIAMPTELTDPEQFQICQSAVVTVKLKFSSLFWENMVARSFLANPFDITNVSIQISGTTERLSMLKPG